MINRNDEFADLETPRGPMRTHLFRPVVEGKFPAVILYSEIYQVTAPIRRAAEFLAGHGFLVAAPEVYHEFELPSIVFEYDKPGTDRGNELKTTMADAGLTLSWHEFNGQHAFMRDIGHRHDLEIAAQV